MTHREVLDHAHQRVVEWRCRRAVIGTHHRAHDAGAFGIRPVRTQTLLNIEYRFAGTGFNPSRASGSARETMTDMEYSRNEPLHLQLISMGSM